MEEARALAYDWISRICLNDPHADTDTLAHAVATALSRARAKGIGDACRVECFLCRNGRVVYRDEDGRYWHLNEVGERECDGTLRCDASEIRRALVTP
jgi:hypothetical protein